MLIGVCTVRIIADANDKFGGNTFNNIVFTYKRTEKGMWCMRGQILLSNSTDICRIRKNRECEKRTIWWKDIGSYAFNSPIWIEQCRLTSILTFDKNPCTRTNRIRCHWLLNPGWAPALFKPIYCHGNCESEKSHKNYCDNTGWDNRYPTKSLNVRMENIYFHQ